MSDLTIKSRSSCGEFRKILAFSDLPEAVRDRVLAAAIMVSVDFGNGEIGECESHVEADLEELENAVREMGRYAKAAGPRSCD